MIKIKNLNKEYSGFSLQDINFDIGKGEVLTLLGESGCGKSTLLKSVSGVIEDFTGDVFMNGRSIKGISPADTGISMVFQNSLLFPNMNVIDNVTFGLKIKRISKKERDLQGKEILKELGLEGFEKRHPYDLSGGQQQRVSIARALVMNPKLLLMDEPFSALDQNLRGKMQELLRKLQKKFKTTILFVTHDRDEAFYLSDRIAIMRDGKIEQVDSPYNIYNSPKNEFVSKFLGINNIFNGTVENSLFISKEIQLRVDSHHIDGRYKLALKSEDLRVVREDKGATFPGTIYDFSFRGGFYHIKVQIKDKKIVEVVQNNVKFDLYIGKKIFVKYSTDTIIKIGEKDQRI